MRWEGAVEGVGNGNGGQAVGGQAWWGSVFLGTRKFGGEARAGHDIILGYDPGGAYLGPGGVRGELRI